VKQRLIAGAVFMSTLNLAQADQHAITQVINNYAQGTATADTKIIDHAFHHDFRVIALTKEGPRVIDKATYLSLLKDGKIGGIPRKLEVKHIEVQDKTAHARISLTSDKVVFNDQLQFIQEPQGWKIINNLTEVTAIQD
jgi:hypothetical protein